MLLMEATDIRLQGLEPSVSTVAPLMTESTSRRMQAIAAQVRRVAPTSATVFLRGESGTGKDMIAQAIHRQSQRSDRPFVPVNCGGMSPHLIESELFGHEKGSFTGAVREHKGVFERACGGTLFLDEVTEMPVELQVKLLRVLETRRFSRVGGETELQADVRIVAATNQNPESRVKSGQFRADLLYRLQVFPIALPPLRERVADIRDLACYFLRHLNHHGGVDKAFAEDALQTLENHSWPGNLRELKNAIERAHIMADRLITRADLPDEVANPVQCDSGSDSCITVSVGSSVAEVESALIFATLNQCQGKKEAAARILGISLKTLYNRLRHYEDRKDD